jgi:hypothetical protein
MRTITMMGFVLAGCHDPGDGTVPESGSWSYTATRIPKDECGIAGTLGLESGSFDVKNHGDGTLTVDDGTWKFDCTLSGVDLECPKRFPGGYSTMGVNLNLEGEAIGTFSTNESAEGEQFGTMTCGGDRACQTGAAMIGLDPPCDVTVKFEMLFEG